MSQWTRNKVNSENINKGNEYSVDSDVSLEELNAMVNSGLYSQDFVEKIVQNIDVSEAGNVGTPSVTLVDGDGATTDKPYKKFKFANLKGQKGDDGDKGEQGIKGDKGDTGLTPIITATATTLPAGSSATVTKSGTDENPTFNFGIPKGDKGEQGLAGTTNYDDLENKPDLSIYPQKDLSNVTYPTNVADGIAKTGAGDRVIETYISSDGNTWYRKWASGWKECGGIVGTGSAAYRTLSLPLSFSNTNYVVNITPITTSVANSNLSAKTYTKKFDSFQYAITWGNNQYGNEGFQYYVCGF